jgi:hypothetical protein
MCLCSAKLLTFLIFPDSTIEISGFFNFDCQTGKMKNEKEKRKKKKGGVKKMLEC